MKKKTKTVFILLTVYLLLVGLLALIETSDPESKIRSYGDALWYSLVTISTVGYGDMTPHTIEGKFLGLIFVFGSVGVFAAMIGLGLRFIGELLIPVIRLWSNRENAWYAFSEWNADTVALANALYREQPNCSLIIPAGENELIASGNIVHLPMDVSKLVRLRGETEGLYLFFMAGEPWVNYSLAFDASSHGIMSYCMGDIYLESVPEKLRMFNLTEVVSRKYWDEHPLLDSERCVILIGCGQFGIALLERALLNNVFFTERNIEYHFFGNTEFFSDLHPEIVKALDRSSATGDRLILHKDQWTSNRILLLKANRIIICEDEDGKNIASCQLLKRWYVNEAAIHVRMDTAVPGYHCFGERFSNFTPEYVMKDELNRRAILMNDIYNENSPSPTSWRELSPFLQASNIAAADHLMVKVRCLLDDETLTDLSGEDCAKAYARYQELNPDQADLFQEMEHRRWIRFYQMYNWQYAPKRNNILRHHPLLLPYAQLSVEERAKDAYAWKILGKLADSFR